MVFQRAKSLRLVFSSSNRDQDKWTSGCGARAFPFCHLLPNPNSHAGSGFISVTTPDDVRISARVRSPATFGTTILLPVDAHAWPADRLDAVLAHERAHVRSRDGYWSWLAQFHAAIFWFNPLALVAAAPPRSAGGNHQRRRGRRRAPRSRRLRRAAARFRPSPQLQERCHVCRRIECPRAHRTSSRPHAARRRVAALRTLERFRCVDSRRRTRGLDDAGRAARGSRGSRRDPRAGARADSSRGRAHLSSPRIRTTTTRRSPRHEKVSGYAIVEVDVDVLGQLVDARVLKVQPADPRFGFADAALQVARNTHIRKYEPASGFPAVHGEIRIGGMRVARAPAGWWPPPPGTA